MIKIRTTKEELLKEVEALKLAKMALEEILRNTNQEINELKSNVYALQQKVKEVEQAHETLDMLPGAPLSGCRTGPFISGYRYPPEPKLTLSQRIVGYAVEAMKPKDVCQSPNIIFAGPEDGRLS